MAVQNGDSHNSSQRQTQALARRMPRRRCVAADLPGRMRGTIRTRHEPSSKARGKARGGPANETHHPPA